ncbi:3045_t:CDS:1 [Gigaspora margarita]|uniref:3045_t:CDS:1 n=1 Tax=Gigaspora margarita TaxID=4874 RepID=A0ABN7W687_GIGMA|nr:3045_t:CDS:1 [Gigaspora margarita]
MAQEKEFYSKVCVAESFKFIVDETNEEDVNLSENNKFSCNLTTILARDKEVVAVNLKLLPNKCKVYIAKNGAWSKEDYEYVNKIKEILINVSKDAPMTFEKTCAREDMENLYITVMKYCCNKFIYRLDKLKKDVTGNEKNIYIKTFLDFAKSQIKGDIFEINLAISKVCCEYYRKTAKKDFTFPKKFLRHIKKVGSYYGSLMNITSCVRREKYKTSFSCIDMHLLDPITVNQVISPWSDIVKPFIHDSKEYENFMKMCLENLMIKFRLKRIYGHVDAQLNNEKSILIYLHPELNVLVNILSQDKESKFIAVSKRSCYLCDSYIRFVQNKGHKITVSGSCKKLYHGWKLPDTFKKEFMSNTIFTLDNIIEREIEHHTDIIAKSDSEAESVDNDVESCFTDRILAIEF